MAPGRRQLLVDRSYQLRLATRLIVTLFAVAIVSYGGAVLLLWDSLSRPELADRYYLIAGLLGGAVVVFLELILVIPIVAYLSILHTQRIVGPKRRLIKAIHAIAAGDFSQRIFVRRGDTLEEVASAINDLAQQLEQRPPQSS